MCVCVYIKVFLVANKTYCLKIKFLVVKIKYMIETDVFIRIDYPWELVFQQEKIPKELYRSVKKYSLCMN